MRTVALFRLIILPACAVAAGAAPAAAMIDGRPDGNAHPNVASIGIRVEDGWGHMCTGVLIAPRVVATSGHCTELWETFALPVEVTFDAEPGAAPFTYAVKSIHTHPGWRSRFLIRGNAKCGEFGQCGEDVGVVVLEASPPGVIPAQLPALDRFAGFDAKTTLFTAVGYGIQGFHPMFHPTGCCTRQAGTFRALPAREVMSGMYLKLAGEGTTAASSGDSGGPAFFGATTTIAGLFSVHQAWAESPSYFYRLDTASALAFLAPFVAVPST